MQRASLQASGLVLASVLWLLPGAALGGEAGSPGEVLLLGPLPAAPGVIGDKGSSFTVSALPELTCLDRLPDPSTEVEAAPGLSLSWRRVETDAGGRIALDAPGVTWLAAAFRLDRWTRVSITAKSDATRTTYIDGDEKASTSLARGSHVVLVRMSLEADAALPANLRLAATTDPDATLSWNLETRTPPASFERMRDVPAISGLAVSPNGATVARKLTLRHRSGESADTTLDLFDGAGRRLASDLGPATATPLAFTPGGKRLLLSARGKNGTNLLLWTAPSGPAKIVLRDEPGLGLVRFSPDGRFLLFASQAGTKARDPGDSPRRRVNLRERLPDYTPRPHLHLIDLASGTRRRLTQPGDDVLDDAVFLGNRPAVVYARTRPRSKRPWFETELRTIDLPSGRDELLTTFVGSWEVRPQSLAADPAGRRLAFIGPPEEVGGSHPERNHYNKQVYLMDLAGGSFQRISPEPWSYDKLLGWDEKGRLIARVTEGSGVRIGLLEPTRSNPWKLSPLTPPDGVIGSTAISPDQGAVAYTASTATSPARLHLLNLTSREDRVLDDPGAGLREHWIISKPAGASFAGPSGEPIEAWSYPPSVRVDQGKLPLIVYYYGGVSPTTRGFNPTHQILAANGYTVLVVNPRGAVGYGDTFADHHAGDWGPEASADILAAVDAFLAAHSEIDRHKIGIYGGSYGGFMTEYLVTVSQRFAAAVSMYGIADLSTYWGQGAWGVTYGDMALGGRTPWADPEYFTSHSPLFRADKITTPLLLLHGTVDDNVTPGESEELFAALSVQSKPVELVLFPDESHGLSGRFADRVAHRTMLIEWYDRFLRDQPEAWQARWE